MKFKKISFVLFSLLLLSITVMSATAANLYDNFESYSAGDVDDVTSFWNCSSFGSSFCQVRDHSSLQGGKSGFVTNNGLSEYSVFTDIFGDISSGVVNVWVKVNSSTNGGAGLFFALLNDTTVVAPSLSETLAYVNYRSTGVKVWNGTFDVNWNHGSGDSFVDLSNNPYYWRIRVDFNSDTIEYFQYDENKTYRSKHDMTSSILNISELKYFLIFAEGGPSFTSYTYFDEVDIYAGNSMPSVSNVGITPSNPDENDTLSCSYSFSDGDFDPDESKIVWRVNTVAQSSFENYSFFPAGNVVGGDVVSCSVTAFDGVSFGNTGSDSVTVIGGVLSLEETVLSVSLDDEVDLSLNVYGLDFDVLSGSYSGFVSFIGRNATDNLVGYTSLFQPNQFGNSYKKAVDDVVFYDVSTYEDVIWTASEKGILRYRANPSLTLLSNFSSVGETYLDVQAKNDSSAFACYQFFDSEALVSFNVNSSGLFDLGLLSIGCKGLEYDGGEILYVDSGLDGVTLVNVSDLESLSIISSWDSRSAYFWGGRHDSISFNSNTLFTDSGDLTGFTLDVSDPYSISYPLTLCDLPSSSDVHFSVESYNESLMFSSNLVEGDLYMCDYVSGSNDIEAFKLYDNPSGSSASYDLVLFQEAGQNFLYGSTGQELQVFKFFVSSQSVNQLPSFVDSTPDSQFVDNLNPISTNVTPVGVETPVVNVYPFTCVNPNLYDCSVDPEGDALLFAIDKDNDGVLDVDWSSFENKFVTYNESGLKTLRVYLTDDVHPNVYSVYRDFTVNVSGLSVELGANESTLKFQLFDDTTNEFVSGVFVSINNQSSGYTNLNGEFTEVLLEDVYLVTFSKDDYYDKYNFFSTSPITYEVFLSPVISDDKRTLVLDVKNNNGSLLPAIFVELYMPITQSFDFKTTDANGRVVFSPDEDNVVVTVQKDGYTSQEVRISVPLGSFVSREIFLEGLSVSRGGSCQDYLANTWMCGYSANCSVDSDCITGRCGTNNVCSSFNWTLCDVEGMDRGNRCVLKKTGTGVLSAVGDWILNNFLYVLIIIILLLVVLVWKLGNK